MKFTLFSSKSYDEDYFGAALKDTDHACNFQEARLAADTAALAEGSRAVCAFVNDALDRGCIQQLHARGIDTVAMRCAGFNNVDLEAAAELGVRVVRVPAYSPFPMCSSPDTRPSLPIPRCAKSPERRYRT